MIPRGMSLLPYNKIYLVQSNTEIEKNLPFVKRNFQELFLKKLQFIVFDLPNFLQVAPFHEKALPIHFLFIHTIVMIMIVEQCHYIFFFFLLITLALLEINLLI